jgi:hypothetical protein
LEEGELELGSSLGGIIPCQPTPRGSLGDIPTPRGSLGDIPTPRGSLGDTSRVFCIVFILQSTNEYLSFLLIINRHKQENLPLRREAVRPNHNTIPIWRYSDTIPSWRYSDTLPNKRESWGGAMEGPA